LHSLSYVVSCYGLNNCIHMHLRHDVVALGVYFLFFSPLSIPCLTIQCARVTMMRDFEDYEWVG